MTHGKMANVTSLRPTRVYKLLLRNMPGKHAMNFKYLIFPLIKQPVSHGQLTGNN
jgi:hypothetical protein